jgi:hypothetical protein
VVTPHQYRIFFVALPEKNVIFISGESEPLKYPADELRKGDLNYRIRAIGRLSSPMRSLSREAESFSEFRSDGRLYGQNRIFWRLLPDSPSLTRSAIWHYKLQRMSGTDFTTSFSRIACNEPERYDIVGANLLVS